MLARPGAAVPAVLSSARVTAETRPVPSEVDARCSVAAVECCRWTPCCQRDFRPNDIGQIGVTQGIHRSWAVLAVVYPGRSVHRPVRKTYRRLRSAPLAQSAERLHGKEKVYGSIP